METQENFDHDGTENVENLDLFADELDDRMNPRPPISCAGCMSTFGCAICCYSTFCTF